MKIRYTLNQSNADIRSLDTELQTVNPVCLDILFKRGFTTSEKMREVLFPSIKQAVQPLRCMDIKPAILTLAKAVQDKQPIVVYRDYDVDGIAAGATAVECLSNLGADVHHYVNRREVDGFGICINGIDNILKRWPKTQVILTVDNGVNGVEAVKYANSRGLTVVITDHHEPGSELPPAAAVIDLKRKDEIYPYHDFCGCALIFRVMLDLYRYLKQDLKAVLKTLDLVALASVADVVPLLGENRALVKQGLLLIESEERPFFRVILRLLEIKEITANYTLGFQIAPILNSLSRLEKDTELAVEALVSKDFDWVKFQCADFININKQRKEITQKQTEEAAAIAEQYTDDPFLVVYSDNFDEGIAGIIAGRLKEQFWKPAIVLARAEDGNLKGSGRSIDEISILEVLNTCSEYLVTFGGHKKAAGLSVKADSLDAFREAVNKYTKSIIAGKEIAKEVPLGAVLTEDTLSESLVHDLRILEPYGEGFPEPVFGLKATPDSIRFMGTEGQHVKLLCSRSGLSIISWNKADAFKNRCVLPRKFIGKPKLNIWKGTVSVQFITEE
ncbi:MAG: single-stranded-DNA-specific exonuclease RecJ [Oscillospiraceae bacterium]|nr:single-stranded-DNA-specific exonuclease RecJ [Oscillospiraceae bacterium]